MKKLTIKIIALILVACIMLSACNQEQSFTYDPPYRKEQIHQYTVKETEDYLINNGSTSYVVVFPEQTSNELTSLAVKEMLTFFNQATGIAIKSSSDKGLNYDSNSRYISIGNTTLAVDAGIEIDKTELGSAGFVIKTVGESVFILGGAYGEIYGVYQFLYSYFGFKVYADDEIALETGVQTKKFLNFDVKDVPDIEYMNNPYTGRYASNIRLRLLGIGDVYSATRGLIYHNALKGILPYELYGIDWTQDYTPEGVEITQTMKNNILEHPEFSAHPEWFNHPEWYVMEKNRDDDPTGNPSIIEPCQLNLTISEEGWTKEQNELSQELFYEVALYEMKKALDDSVLKNITFTHQDNTMWSEDAISKANYEKYGTHAAEYIQCVNHLARELKKYEPTARVCIFVYAQMRKAPVIKVGGKYQPIDQSVVLEDNVTAIQCYGYLNRHYAFDDFDANATVIEEEAEWSCLVNTRYTWLYSMTYYSNPFLPASCFNGMVDIYRHLYEGDYKFIFEESQIAHNNGAPDWADLKIYLSSQLRWNVYQDYETLLNDFFNNFYKAAAKPMRELFDAEQLWLTHLNEKYDDISSFGGETYALSQLMKQESWPDNLLQQFLAKIDEAYKAIEIYRGTNDELYKLLYNRINIESLSFRYLRAEIYGNYYGELKSQWFSSLYNDCKKYEITRFGLRSMEEVIGNI